MASGVFNIARGRIGYYATQVGVGNAAFVVVLLKATQADSALVDHATLGAVLAHGSNTEADFTNYARKTITSVSGSPDNTSNTLDLEIGNLEYEDAGGASDNDIHKIIVGFDPDTTGGDDSDIIPLAQLDPSSSPPVATDGSTITFIENADGFYGSE